MRGFCQGLRDFWHAEGGVGIGRSPRDEILDSGFSTRHEAYEGKIVFSPFPIPSLAVAASG